MTEKTMFIPARLKSSVVNGHVAGASDIIDDTKGKTQDEINAENDASIADIEGSIGSLDSRVTANKQDADTKFEAIKGGSNKSIQNLSDEIATKQGTLTFDNSPELGSNNPVKSNGIKVALDEKQDTLTFDNTPTDGSVNMVRSGAIKSYVDAEKIRAMAAEQANANGISGINAKIPNQASAQNQLADKDFVNSSIGTNTAHYISNGGQPFDSYESLQAYTGEKTNNDYAFVATTDAEGNNVYKRYKYNSATSTWAFEYQLNNSSFTSEQWAAISSGITALLTEKLRALPTATELTALLAQKQDTLTIDSTPTVNSNNPISSDAVYDLQQATLTALSGKQNTLTFDLAPTIGSGNPVTSGGVATAIAEASELDFVEVETLPAPTASTVGKIYVIHDVENDTYIWYVTTWDTSVEPATYAWKKVNNSSVDLSDYYTKEQVDALVGESSKYSDIYIGVAETSASIATGEYHHDSITKDRPITFSNANGYLWIIAPENHSPVATMGNIELPMSLDSTTTIEEKVYKVWKSANSYSGSFNIYLL